MIDRSAPFVLLDDARPAGAGPARLFRRPVEIIATHDPAEVAACLGRLRKALADGRHAAGFLAYEAGHSLEPRLAPLSHRPAEGEVPLLWFGVFDGCEPIDPNDVATAIPDSGDVQLGPPIPLVRQEDYAVEFRRVAEHIAAGNIYQVNLTFPAEVPVKGDPLALYARLRARSGAGHGGILFTGEHWVLSCSPELFFALEGGKVTARPMKGTAPRLRDPAADAGAAAALAADPKQRAENLMIVDLLRNDLSRVARAGTVRVDPMFAVETYPTVHQMTSTVHAELEQGLDAIDLLAATFPCGSVTGAPKIRAMEIIAEVEHARRGIYTGSLGRLAPDGEASFNVVIRTLVLRDGETRARLGLGSAVVADSRADEEWRECLAKGKFVSDGTGCFDLIETMAFDPHEGILNLERHLARLKESAEVLGFGFDRHDARNELQAATFRFRDAKKIRLRLSRSGAIAIESRDMPPFPDEPVAVVAVPFAGDPGDFRLRHKTSDRTLYDPVRAAAGAFEVLFVDAEGFVTQGSFTNVFVERDGMLLTPPLSRGLLPGVLRDQLIADGQAREAELRPEDLAGGFCIGNAVRGLIDARLTPSA